MNWILDRLQVFGNETAFIDSNGAITYRRFSHKVQSWLNRLQTMGIKPGTAVALVGEYSPETASLLLALMINGNIAVPLTRETRHKHPKWLRLANVSRVFEFAANGKQWNSETLDAGETHALLKNLGAAREAGLVLFTSGTSGESKGVVLRAPALLERFRNLDTEKIRSLRALVFLKLDHIGGINTLFSILFKGGTAISIEDRSPRSVCAAIARHRVELLPTTPTFLNMLLISGIHQEFDLSSLRVVTYGTEPMPASTLAGVNKTFPAVKFKQTYGLTELGIFSTQSKHSDSGWMKVGGKGVETRIVANTLHIRTPAAMLGYLNAPSPFDAGGWYNTGDRVEVDGDYIRILGRESEIINVGGEKVYPAEVESVIQEMHNVKEVLVNGKSNVVTGQIVIAMVILNNPEDRRALSKRLMEHCRDRLEPYKVPKLVVIRSESFISNRLKKIRKGLHSLYHPVKAPIDPSTSALPINS